MDLWYKNRPGARGSASHELVPTLNLLLHASYDRVFQAPAVENLLLASSPLLEPSALRYCDCRSGRDGGIFMRAELLKRSWASCGWMPTFSGAISPIFGRRCTAGYRCELSDCVRKSTDFRRRIRVEIPQWGRFSGYLSYANQSGYGQGPITGGLFLGSDAANPLTNTSKFAVNSGPTEFAARSRAFSSAAA